MPVTRITDQIAHFVVGFSILLLFAKTGLVGGAVAGLCLGLIRETAEAGGSRITLSEVIWHFRKRLDPWIDLLFWSLGGLVAAYAVQAL